MPLVCYAKVKWRHAPEDDFVRRYGLNDMNYFVMILKLVSDGRGCTAGAISFRELCLFKIRIRMKYAWNFLLHHVDRDPAGRMHSKLIFTLNYTKERGLVWISSKCTGMLISQTLCESSLYWRWIVRFWCSSGSLGWPSPIWWEDLGGSFPLKVSYLCYSASLEETYHGPERRSGDKGEIEWKKPSLSMSRVVWANVGLS